MRTIRVCNSSHCSYRGSGKIMAALEKIFGISAGNKNESVDLAFCPCTGFCEQGPNVVVNDEQFYLNAKPETIAHELETSPGKTLQEISADIANLNVDSLFDKI